MFHLRLRNTKKRRQEQSVLEAAKTKSPAKQTKKKKLLKAASDKCLPAKKRKCDPEPTVNKEVNSQSDQTEDNQNIFDYLNLSSGTASSKGVSSGKTEAIIAPPIDTHSEPVHNETEPVHGKTESVHNETEPVHGKTEAVHGKTGSVHNETEPVHGETESVEIEQNVPNNLQVAVVKKRAKSNKIHFKKMKELPTTLCYTCPKCPENFSNKTILRIHSISIHDGLIDIKNVIPVKKSYIKCSRCSLKFFNQFQLNNHKITCHTFSKQLDSINIDLDEVNSVEAIYFTCLVCPDKFFKECDLQSHASLHHEGPTPLYFCGVCNESFDKKEDFRYHNTTCRSSVIVEKSNVTNEFTVRDKTKFTASGLEIHKKSTASTLAPKSAPELETTKESSSENPVVESIIHEIEEQPLSTKDPVVGNIIHKIEEPPLSTKDPVVGNIIHEIEEPPLSTTVVGNIIQEIEEPPCSTKNPVIKIVIHEMEEPQIAESSSDDEEDDGDEDYCVWESTKIDLNTTKPVAHGKSPVKKVVLNPNVKSTINMSFFQNSNQVSDTVNKRQVVNSRNRIKIPTFTYTVPKSSDNVVRHTESQSDPVLIYKPKLESAIISDPEVEKSEELKIAWQQMYCNNIKCVRCDMSFKNHRRLNDHLDEVHGDELSQLSLLFQEPKVNLASRCGQCSATFDSNALLKKHWKDCKKNLVRGKLKPVSKGKVRICNEDQRSKLHPTKQKEAC